MAPLFILCYKQLAAMFKGLYKMKKTLLHLFQATFFLLLSTQAPAATNTPYQLQAGDVIYISVWGEKDLQKDVKVLPDGSITFPLAGRIEVSGQTTPDIEARVKEKLKPFFPEPQVTVSVLSTEGSKAYIIGKVLKPGPIPFTGPITALQALSMAGGIDKFADSNNIRILRSTTQGQTTLRIPYERLLRGEELESNVQLMNGDTILVP